MWPFLNPLECKVAEQCLAQNNPLEAARVLLAAKQPAHRAVRALLLRIGPLLVALGRRAAEEHDVLIAAELLEVAARCGSLPPTDEQLRRQLVERRDQLARDRQWREQRLDRAAQWARDGRLRSALGLVAPLDADPEAERRRRDWQFDLETLERYAQEFEHHLQANELPAAIALQAKANQLAPRDPKVWAMRQALQAAGIPTVPPVNELAAAGNTSPVRPSTQDRSPAPTPPPTPTPQASTASWRAAAPGTPAAASCAAADQGDGAGEADGGEFDVPRACQIVCSVIEPLVVSGLTALGAVLVLARPHILIGTQRELAVDLPMSARLHGREALLVREAESRGVERWRVVPLGTAIVKVNGDVVAAPGSRTLADGDTLEFESDHCRWRFRLPLRDSATAVLSVVRPSPANIPLPDQASSEIVALVADRLVIANDREQGHLVQRELPGPLTLTPSASGWRLESAGLPLFADSDRLPIQLTMYADKPDLTQQIVCDTNAPRHAFKWSLQLKKGTP